MDIEMKVPSVGESITEVTIASWSKKDGDFVKTDEILCELESDKATFEVPSKAEGILRIIASKGATLPIGALICRIEAAKATKTAPSEPSNTQAAPKNAASTEKKLVEMKVPAVGESINEVTLSKWHKKEGEKVKAEEILCEIESDKATFELNALASGTLRIVAKEGSTLPIGSLICHIETSDELPVAVVAPVQNTVSQTVSSTASSYAQGHPSPAAGKILAEKGISPSEVNGSGTGGRLTKEDALKAEKKTAALPTPAPTIMEQKTPENQSTSLRNSRREKMTSLRKTVAKRLVSVKNETAMLTTFNEVDMKAVMDLRNKYKDLFKEKHEIGLGFMSFFVKACCTALKEFPAVNAYIDGDEIIYNDFADISIAVSAPKGLVVPVIRNAEQMNFAQIEKEVIRLAGKARDNKLSIPEMTGGTFTITNGGVFGSLMSTPIINAPQSAILGMHNIVQRPIAVDNQVVIRPMMYIALSYDHRIIDGRESVSFLVRVKQLIEDPSRLLLAV
jgi:2-oxoglutarate dehydrogenase E2 component (dihydrolipoamide succinyltransferase)